MYGIQRKFLPLGCIGNANFCCVSFYFFNLLVLLAKSKFLSLVKHTNRDMSDFFNPLVLLVR